MVAWACTVTYQGCIRLPYFTPEGYGDGVPYRHNGGMNFGFCDGHVAHFNGRQLAEDDAKYYTDRTSSQIQYDQVEPYGW